MINIFSIGILYSSQELIDLVENTKIEINEFYKCFKIFKVADSKCVLNTSLKYNWIKIDKNNNLINTDIGKKIFKNKCIKEKLKLQILSFINIEKPNWSSLICYGREETLKFMPPEIKQCFSEAGLLDKDYSKNIISWWDNVAFLIRKKHEESNLIIGRYGERLSLSYEQIRTGIRPIWKAIESNLCGYDILSQISFDNNEMLKIEVKTTTSYNNPYFYISKNEYEVAIKSRHYQLHLWIISHKISLYILNSTDLTFNIPNNKGNGEWQNIKIYFSKKNKVIIDEPKILKDLCNDNFADYKTK